MEKINLKERKKSRRLVLQALYQWQIAHHDLQAIEKDFLTENDKFDKLYFLELLHEIPLKVETLDLNILPYVDRKIDEISPIELTILRIGTYEMLNRLDVPYRVVINEAVELAKTYGASESHKYINGVLDKAAKQLRNVEIRGT